MGRLESRYVLDHSSDAISTWIERNTTLKKRPFSFADYEFQRAIADDMHPDLVVPKCSQVGLTEVELRKFLAFLTRNTAVNALFSLPNEVMFKRVSQTRLKPILDTDKVFNMEGDEDSVRSMSTIQIGGSYGYITGCTEKDATSLPVDALFHDELDLSPPNMIGLFQSRLQNSNWKITQSFSTLTFTGFGVDKKWKVSDQREYTCQCVACRHVQVPLFSRRFCHIPGLPDDLDDLSKLTHSVVEQLDLANSYVQCERCGAPLDLANPDLREWIAKYPSRHLVRGYRVRPFSTGRLTIAYIIGQLLKYQDQDYVRGWYNTVLGEPYIDGKAQLTQEEIEACLDTPGQPGISSSAPVFIGIDIGQMCHIVLATGLGMKDVRVFSLETVHVNHLAERVQQILDTYNIIGGCVDRHPYTPTAEQLRDISQGRIMPVEYRGSDTINPVKDEYKNITHFQANRTRLIDLVPKVIRDRNIRIAGYGDQRSVLIEHLRDMIRDEKPDEPAKWVKLNGNDHYFHALAFMMFAIRLVTVISELSGAEPRSVVDMLGADLQASRGDALGARHVIGRSGPSLFHQL